VRASELVFNKIVEKIVSREWAPGMKITSETQLAQDLNVSRISVRGAIEKLAAMGVLDKRRGDGTYVTSLSPNIYMNNLTSFIMLSDLNLIEILEFRMILEVDTTRLCAERRGEETVRQLEEQYGIMCRTNSISEEFAEADLNFHRALAEGSANELIIKVNSLLFDLLKFQQKRINEYLGPSGGLAEHKKILEAVKDQDPELAAIHMRRHIQLTTNRIIEIERRKLVTEGFERETEELEIEP